MENQLLEVINHVKTIVKRNQPSNKYWLTLIVAGLISTDDTLPDPSWFLFQESQFSTSIYTTPITHSTVTSVTSISHSKEDSNHNKQDLKAEWSEQLNAELKASKSFIREELCLYTSIYYIYKFKK